MAERRGGTDPVRIKCGVERNRQGIHSDEIRSGRTLKYGNKKTVIDGQVFDSRREGKRWCELRLMEKAGAIKNLNRQVSFELIPSIRENGRTVQRAITYKADFVYEKDGQMVVEDAKGFLTEVYKLKKKLVRWQYGIDIVEV